METTHLVGENPCVVGVSTEADPASEHKSSVGVLILSAGLLHRPGPFRLHVDLARRLGSLGFNVLRIDQSGRGDSGRGRGMSAEECLLTEFDSVAEWFERTLGINELILVGLCSGADDAIQLADCRSSVVGLVLLDGYCGKTRRFITRSITKRFTSFRELASGCKRFAVRIAKRVLGTRLVQGDASDEAADLVDVRNFPESSLANSAFGKVASRGGNSLCVFTGGVDYYYNYEGQLADSLRLDERSGIIQEHFFASANHTYPIHTHRKALINLISDWAEQFKLQR